MDDPSSPSAQPSPPQPQKATTTTSSTSNTAPQQHPPQHALLATFMTDDSRGNNGEMGAEKNVKSSSQTLQQYEATTKISGGSTTTTTSRNQKDTVAATTTTSSFSSSSLVFEVEEIPAAAAASGQAQGVEPTRKAAAGPPPSVPKSPTITTNITERTIPLPSVDNGGGDDNDEDVQVILPPPPRPRLTDASSSSPTTQNTTTAIPEDDDLTATTLRRRQEQREERRRKTQRFLRILKKKTNQGPNGLPSFLAVVNTNIDEDDDDDDDRHDDDNSSISSPFKVVIDVDAYLGLKQKNPDLVRSLSSTTHHHDKPAGEEAESSLKPLAVPSSRISATTLNNNNTTTMTTTTTTTTPVEEGYYEGSLPMAMPEDATYLSDIHVYLRQHLEFFSATDLDVELSHTGRRTKAVRGQVGIRCRHCAQHVLAQIVAQEQSQPGSSSTSSRKVSWPPGAVSYPVKFEGLYSTASQKPQLHFEACPYLPVASELAQLIQEARSEQPGNAPLTGIGKRKRMVQGMSGLEYYIVSCQRVGLQEIPGGRGIRFTRDLSLAPLDFDRIRAQVEQDRPDLIPRQHHVAALATTTTSKARKTPKIEFSSSPQAASVQKVLQEALKEPDNSKEFLIRSQDKAYLTDYMFLAISQMALCWASRQDFAARGKRTKNLRLGLTGFCCKHCYHNNNGANSCRSYSSAPDNLASAISNSFILHLQKCPYTPSSIKNALVAAKRYHTQQMGQMVYGSQRKLFLELWDRMRAKDKIVPEDEEGNSINKEEGKEDQEEWNPDEGEDADGTSQPPVAAPVPFVAATTFDEHRPNTRGPDFPVSIDPEVVATLKKAEENWDTSVNDHLIEPQDRHLVSDYVFLTMRQLKSAMPRPSDFRGNRRNNILNHMPGLACIHCAHDPLVTSPSGRSFPSAPDNMASALNSSFSNHMQYCPHLDPTIKRCLAILRKIHSQQCASMNFGSQRKYFTKVYEKLKAIPMPNTLEEELPTVFDSRGNGATPSSAKDILRDHAFVQAGTNLIPFWQCLKCRMVPFEFRGVGGVHYVQPILPHLQQHRKICKEDGIHLGWTLIAVKELWAKYGSSRQEEGLLESAMKPLIEIVVGKDADLTSLFLECLASRGNETPALIERNTQGWWRRLPHSVDSIQLQQAFEISTCQLLDLASTQLEDHPLILRLLEIISPCLQYQQPVSDPPLHPQQAEGRTSPIEVDEGPMVPKTMPLESQRTEQLPQKEGRNQGGMLIAAIDSTTGISSGNQVDEIH